MRKFILLIAICWLSKLQAQETAVNQPIFDKIALSVGVPHDHNLTSKQIKRLGIKTKQLATRNGLSAMGNQQLILYPELDIMDPQKADLLEETLYVVEAEVTFSIQQLDNNYVFHSQSITVEGSGNSKEAAIYSAINDINPKSSSLRKFIAEGKKRITDYYNQQCTTLIEKAIALAEMKQFKQSLAILSSIPEDGDCCCHHTAREAARKVYFAYQDQNCAEWLQKAKTYYANNQFADAFRILGKIDPLSFCGNEVENLIAQIGKQVDAKERLQLELIQERYHDKVQMEVNRLEVIRDIMTIYYSNQPVDLQQFVIIK